MSNLEYELGLAMINLQLAVNEDNLEDAKTLVSFLNTNYAYEENDDNRAKFVLEDCLNLISNTPYNTTFKYVLDNLQNYNLYDEVRWDLYIRYYENLLDNNKDNELIINTIYNFILSNLEKDDLVIYQYNDLIRLIYKIQDFSLLRIVKEKLENINKGEN